MNKNIPDRKDWAGRLREWEAESEELPLAPDNWDTIASELEEDRPRRFLLWWLLPLLGVVFFGGFYTGNSWKNYGPQKLAAAFPLYTEEVKVASPKVFTEAEVHAATVAAKTDQEVKSEDFVAVNRVNSNSSFSPTAIIEAEDNGEVKADVFDSDKMQDTPQDTDASTSHRNREFFQERLTQENHATDRQVATIDPLVTELLYPESKLIISDWPDLVPQVYPSADPLLTSAAELSTPLSVAVGPLAGWSNARIKTRLPQERIRSVSRSQTNELTRGLNVQLKFGKHWGLQTGISWEKESSKHVFRFLRTYTRTGENPAPNGGGSSTFGLELKGDLAKVDSEIDVARPANFTLDRPLLLIFEADLQETLRITSIPLTLTYDLNLNRSFALRLSAGTAYHQQSVELDFSTRLLDRPRLQIAGNRVTDREVILNSSFWTGQFASSLVYSPTGKWEFLLQPQWNTGFGNLAADRENNQADYQRFTLLGGINYKF